MLKAGSAFSGVAVLMTTMHAPGSISPRARAAETVTSLPYHPQAHPTAMPSCCAMLTAAANALRGFVAWAPPAAIAARTASPDAGKGVRIPPRGVVMRPHGKTVLRPSR